MLKLVSTRLLENTLNGSTKILVIQSNRSGRNLYFFLPLNEIVYGFIEYLNLLNFLVQTYFRDRV